MANCHTIIGAKWFHFRVRDGIGWFTFAMVTKQTGVSGICIYIVAHALADVFGKFYTDRWKSVTAVISDNQVTLAWYSLHCFFTLYFSILQPHLKLIGCYMVKPHGQLVHVSFTHYCASTPCLSTS